MVMKPETLISIKQRVKAECARRKYEGSVADYAGTTYDYVIVPGIGKIVKTEHYEKLAVPLNAINAVDTPYTDGHRIMDESEILNMESKIAVYEKQTETSTVNDCSASCTGMCITACSTKCTSYCALNCSTGCSGRCGYCSPCVATCMSSCGTACNNSCANDCGSTCGGCSGSCRGICSSGKTS